MINAVYDAIFQKGITGHVTLSHTSTGVILSIDLPGGGGYIVGFNGNTIRKDRLSYITMLPAEPLNHENKQEDKQNG